MILIITYGYFEVENLNGVIIIIIVICILRIFLKL